MNFSYDSATHDRLEQTAYTRSAVRNLCVAIIGGGALGSEVARLLGLLGLGSVLLIDHDVVEATNLTHSPYLRSANAIGRSKVEVLAEALSQHFPDTRWSKLSCEIADAGFEHLRNCALLFSCTDNALARVETCYAAHRLGLPMMDSGLKGRAFWSGRVTWFPGGPAACYLCQLGEARRAELLSLSLAASLSCSAPLPDEHGLPSTPTMASVVAGLQVDLGLRMLLNTTADTAEARVWEISLPLPETTWRSFTIPRSSDCPWHSHDSSLRFASLPTDTAIDESLAQLGKSAETAPPVLELDWPICVQARCSTCRHLWRPMLRLATLRRRANCPACGGSRLHSVETISTVATGDPFAHFTPAELCLSPCHLFTLRYTLSP